MKVAILKDDKLDYCRSAPFHPAERYPEYPFEDFGEGNAIYGKVRELFAMLGMDRDHYGLASWNPLGEIISPGDQVTLKPNFVGHHNPAGSLEAMITQGCIIRAVLDYVDIALKGRGSITVADAPPINTDFGKIVQATGADRIAEYYAAKAGVGVSLVDMRKECGYMKGGKLMHVELEGDPRGYTVVDLKGDSAHAHNGEDYWKFRSANYSSHVMWDHHNRERNEYCIGNSVLGADVVINLPKLKTHNKTGLTCALKNLIGINGYKDWLPHHLAGSREDGGDEYEKRDLRKDLSIRLRDRIADTDSMLLVVPLRIASSVLYYSKVAVPFRDSFTAGCWHGNVTLPKTIADLNRIFFYADKRGQMTDAVQRKMFVLVDSIVAGEREGPQEPTAKRCGVLVAGDNPVAVDLACSRIMGFDYEKMLMFWYAMIGRKYPICDSDPRAMDVRAAECNDFDGIYEAYGCDFAPASGWLGHIEYPGKREPAVQQPKPAPMPASGWLGHIEYPGKREPAVQQPKPAPMPASGWLGQIEYPGKREPAVQQPEQAAMPALKS